MANFKFWLFTKTLSLAIRAILLLGNEGAETMRLLMLKRKLEVCVPRDHLAFAEECMEEFNSIARDYNWEGEKSS